VDSDDELANPEVTMAVWKETGDKAYKAADWRGAIAKYGSGIAAASDGADAESLASLYGNRAAASMMLLKYQDAVADCDAAIAAYPPFAKAYFRKAAALKKL
ncbi:unnamed protein product, partial [Phaeothamnion confervicola]